MSLKSNKPKRTHARLPRSEPLRLEMDDTSQTWAVSYADFLMVLLSFFVIFFSTNKNTENSVIFQVFSDLSKSQTTSGYGRAPDSTGEATSSSFGRPSFPENFAAHINHKFGALLSPVSDNNEKLIINLPDNIYAVGEYELIPSAHEKLKLILKEITPYLPQLSVGFIGHADKIQFGSRLGRDIKNNFDISVLRASRALTLATEMGLNSSHCYASGSGPKYRDSRSLSIVLQPYGGTAL